MRTDFEICSEMFDNLPVIFNLALDGRKEYSDGKGVVGYLAYPSMLLFYSYEPADRQICKLPFKMTMKDAAAFAHGWLERGAVYPESGDGDGTYIKGFRVTHNRKPADWNDPSNDYYFGLLLVVEPYWMYYGK